MKKEVRIGLLFFTALLVLLVGYMYLQGKELFDDSIHYKVRFDSVDKLEKSSKVFANGLQVGTVTDLYLDAEDPDYVIVELKVKPEISLPKTSRAYLVDEGVFGGKSLELRFDKICHEDCILEGMFIQSGKTGPLESFLGDPRQISVYMNHLGHGLDSLFQALSTQIANPENNDKITLTIRALHETALSLASISKEVNAITVQSRDNVNQMLANLNAISGEIRRNNNHIAASLTNIDSITTQLAEGGLKKTIRSTTETVAELRNGIVGFKQTLKGVDNTVKEATHLLASVNRGEGSLGKLTKDSSLYVDLNKAILNLNKLLEDLKENPKRYVHFSVFK